MRPWVQAPPPRYPQCCAPQIPYPQFPNRGSPPSPPNPEAPIAVPTRGCRPTCRKRSAGRSGLGGFGGALSSRRLCGVRPICARVRLRPGGDAETWGHGDTEPGDTREPPPWGHGGYDTQGPPPPPQGQRRGAWERLGMLRWGTHSSNGDSGTPFPRDAVPQIPPGWGWGCSAAVCPTAPPHVTPCPLMSLPSAARQARRKRRRGTAPHSHSVPMGGTWLGAGDKDLGDTRTPHPGDPPYPCEPPTPT